MKTQTNRRSAMTRRQAVQWSMTALAMAALADAARSALGADAPAAPTSGAAPAGSGAAAGVSVTSFDQVAEQKYPWGWIRWLMNSKIDPDAEMTVGIVEINAHGANPLHIHPNCTEYVHVLSGSCKHRVGSKWVSLKAGDTLRVPKGAIHGARTGDEPMRALVVYNTGTRIMTPVDEKKTPAN